jgi:hypothetical protein
MRSYHEPEEEPVYGDTEIREPAGLCEGCERTLPLALIRLGPEDRRGWRQAVHPPRGFCCACSLERAIARGEPPPMATHPDLDED